MWWFLGPGPAMIGAACVAVLACLRGRSQPAGRAVVVGICVAASALTALATSDTVTQMGSAAQPLVTGLVGLLGLLDRPARALPAGAVLVAPRSGRSR